MATHSSTLAWKIPWTEEPGRLQSMGSQSQTRLSDFMSYNKGKGTLVLHINHFICSIEKYRIITTVFSIPGGNSALLPTSAGTLKKQKSSRKASISALFTMPKPLTVWITINCGKF